MPLKRMIKLTYEISHLSLLHSIPLPFYTNSVHLKFRILESFSSMSNRSFPEVKHAKERKKMQTHHISVETLWRNTYYCSSHDNLSPT